MIIPKNFEVAGKIINVEINSNHSSAQKTYGQCLYDQNRIILDDYIKSNLNKQVIEQTFIHEIIHMINAILSKNNTICDDEEYVNPLSELLYQVIKQIGNKNE